MSKIVAMRRVERVAYSDEIAEAICEAIATTPRGIDFLCATHEGFPAARTVRRWERERPNFRAAYELAKEAQSDFLAYETLEIADDSGRDTKVIRRNDGQEVEVLDREWVQRSDIRIKARQWLCKVLNPRRFGDKLDANLTIGHVRYEDAISQLR
jgi:hypothetical protein